jgi:hypothetical protein
MGFRVVLPTTQITAQATLHVLPITSCRHEFRSLQGRCKHMQVAAVHRACSGTASDAPPLCQTGLATVSPLVRPTLTRSFTPYLSNPLARACPARKASQGPYNPWQGHRTKGLPH